MAKVKINLELKFGKNKSIALDLPNRNDGNKIFFSGTLLHAKPEQLEDYPLANKNGEGFLSTSDIAPDFVDNPIGIKEAVSTVIDSALNLIHREDLQVGHIKEATYVEENDKEAAHIDFIGVLQKDTLESYGVTKAEVEDGLYDLSMECFYDRYYYIHGKEVVDPNEQDLEEYVGGTYKNLGVVKIITNPEFSAAALIPSGGQADEDAIIKAVASKYKDDNNQGGKNMFKKLEFETEEEYNQFLEKEKKGYAKLEDVLGQFEGLDLEGDSLEDIAKSVAEIKEKLEKKEQKFSEYKKQVEKDKTFAKRKMELQKVGVEVEEEDKEDIVGMTKKAFALMIKSNKLKIEESKKKNKVEGSLAFDPNIGTDNDDTKDEDGNIATSLFV